MSLVNLLGRTLIISAVTQASRIAGLFIIARYAEKTTYAEYAHVLTVLQLLNILKEYGVREHYMAQSRFTRNNESWFWHVDLVRIIFVLLASYFWLVLIDNRLQAFLMILPAIVIEIISSKKELLIYRQRRLNVLASLDLVSALGLLIGTGFAILLNESYLLLGYSLSIVARTLYLNSLTGVSNYLKIQPQSNYRFLSVGIWLYISAICYAVLHRADKVVLYERLSNDEFADYIFAYSVLFQVLSATSYMTNYVDRSVATGRLNIYEGVKILGAVVLSVLVSLNLLLPYAASLLFGEKWESAYGYFPYFSVFFFFNRIRFYSLYYKKNAAYLKSAVDILQAACYIFGLAILSYWSGLNVHSLLGSLCVSAIIGSILWWLFLVRVSDES